MCLDWLVKGEVYNNENSIVHLPWNGSRIASQALLGSSFDLTWCGHSVGVYRTQIAQYFARISPFAH